MRPPREQSAEDHCVRSQDSNDRIHYPVGTLFGVCLRDRGQVEPVQGPVGHRAPQLLTTADQVEHRHRRNPGERGDAIHCHVLVRVLPEEGQACVEDRLCSALLTALAQTHNHIVVRSRTVIDVATQYDRGRPSECSATKFRIISLDTGPMLSMRTTQ